MRPRSAPWATNTGRSPRALEPGSEGFSLLEVLVASLLLGLAAMSYGTLMLTAAATQERSWEHTTLSATAVERMEGLLQLPFDDDAWQAGGSLTSSAPGYSLEPIPVNADPNGYLRWKITDESVLMKRITVLAGHPNRSATGVRELQVETFRLRNAR